MRGETGLVNKKPARRTRPRTRRPRSRTRSAPGRKNAPTRLSERSC